MTPAARLTPSCVRSYQVHLVGTMSTIRPILKDSFTSAHGIGDLPADGYDWHNPVARVRITRMD